MEKTIAEVAKIGAIFKANSKIKYCKPKNGTDYKLREAQKAVHGNIEVVYPTNEWLKGEGVIGIAREDARGCKYNQVASLIFVQSIFGDVIVCMDEMLK